MKKIIAVTVVLLGLTMAAGAQTVSKKTNNKEKKSIQRTSESQHEARQRPNAEFPMAPANKKLWDPRKIYTWPDGQRATPSGHQAMGINDEQTSLKKDSAWQIYLKQHPEKRRADSIRMRIKGR